MANFLWLIPPEGAQALLKELPRSLIIPFAQANGLQSRLGGMAIWIVDGIDGYLMARVVVHEITEFVEGLYKGDFLINLDFSCSFRVGSRKLNFMESIRSYPPGLSEFNGMDHVSWVRSVMSLVETRFVAPKVESLKIPFQRFVDNATIGLENAAMAFLIQKLSIDEVWRLEKSNGLGPYATFAIALHSASGGAFTNELVNYLDEVDPITQVERVLTDEFSSTKSSRVDLFFSAIDSEQVTRRQFIESGSMVDRSMAISMLNDAERRHQHVLMSLSQFITSVDLIPQQSNSVDLLVNKGSATILCEIKTIHDTNLESQVAKGVYQVIKYDIAMDGRFGEVSPVLILEGRISPIELTQVQKILKRTGVQLIWVGDSNSGKLNFDQFYSLLKKKLDY
jgi:hypothetical protein